MIIIMIFVDVREGLTNASLLETMTDRVIIQFAREVILVVDHSKFGWRKSGDGRLNAERDRRGSLLFGTAFLSDVA